MINTDRIGFGFMMVVGVICLLGIARAVYYFMGG
jgi:hypothetical protein